MNVCVSILSKTIDESLKKIRTAEEYGADLIEIRIDGFEIYDDLSRIEKSTDIPLIATNRPAKEGGFFKEDEKKRIEILIEAAKEGFEYIDIELSTKNVAEIANIIRSFGSKVIISFHDFNRTPSTDEIQEIFEKELNKEADVCKLVTTAKRFDDNLRLFNFIYENAKRTKVVCFAMGEIGKVSRLVSPILGAFFTIASLDKGEETAHGQLGIVEMRELYERLGLSF